MCLIWRSIHCQTDLHLFPTIFSWSWFIYWPWCIGPSLIPCQENSCLDILFPNSTLPSAAGSAHNRKQRVIASGVRAKQMTYLCDLLTSLLFFCLKYSWLCWSYVPCWLNSMDDCSFWHRSKLIFQQTSQLDSCISTQVSILQNRQARNNSSQESFWPLPDTVCPLEKRFTFWNCENNSFFFTLPDTKTSEHLLQRLNGLLWRNYVTSWIMKSASLLYTQNVSCVP